MAVSAILYFGVLFKVFIFACCVITIAHVSGESTATKNSLKCNGRWCVENEEYCDEMQKKCLLCQYTQHNCTPHLDCLSYCIGKGIEQGLQDRQETIKVEESSFAWALYLCIACLVLFIVSFVVNIGFAVWFCRQRRRAAIKIRTTHGTSNQEETELTPPGITEDETPLNPDTNIDNNDTDSQASHIEEAPQEEPMGASNDTLEKEPIGISVQEEGSRSDEKQHLENFP